MILLAKQLGQDILNDSYFIALFHKIEKFNAQKFFGVETEAVTIEEINDLLRFADLLSHSPDVEARNKAYKIISLLSDATNNHQYKEYRIFAEAILTKLGNFPALKHLSEIKMATLDHTFSLPMERQIESDFKKDLQKTNSGKSTFTDSQFKVRQALENYDFFSFSGPTSIGKSFILKDYIQSLLKSPELDGGCIVILVPTRALISQVTKELSDDISDKSVNISSFPANSTYLQQRFTRTVYVFTPERLLSYAANHNVNVKYLFVDEAQKLTSLKDSRSSLYYHAIYETVKKFATKLVFASPNIPNPEIFLSIFEKDARGNMATREQTVSQNRFFVDLIDRRAAHYSDMGDEVQDLQIALPQNCNQLIEFLGKDVNNLIYCNSTAETVERARDFSKGLGQIEQSKDLKTLIKFVAEFVHKEYYLIDCLKKGVAFHHGRMPQQVRKKIEDFFTDKSSPLTYMFCTPTLLEGVNLPAKNIFVVNDRHGLSNFDRIDFENLIGRAGRLTKEFAGNVVCIRDREARWLNTEKLLHRSAPKLIESFLVNRNPRKRKEYLNIAKALDDKPLASSLSVDEAQNYQHYATIMLLHHLENQGSALKVGFLEKTKEAVTILQTAKRNNNVDNDILRISSTIKPKYQNIALSYIANQGEGATLPVIDGETDFRQVLEKLYVLYNWAEEESTGKDPLIPSAMVKKGFGDKRLGYWAMLMEHWIGSKPFNLLIGYSMHYHRERGEIWFIEGGKPTKEAFTGSAKQINIIIEQLMVDIETGLRFKIEKYLLNYYLLCKFQLGESVAGQNWAEQVEYGTADKRSIELQNIGLSRNAASFLIEKHLRFFSFDHDGSLVEINEAALFNDISKDNDYFDEIKQVLRRG